MDGAQHMDTGPEALADYVRRHAPAAGYDLDTRGEQSRLARDAEMDTDVLARILGAKRMPRPAVLWPLSTTLRRPYAEILVVAGIIPSEAVAQLGGTAVASQPITADALADSWGVTAVQGRELVRDMLDRVRLIAQQTPDEPEHGSAAHG